MKILQSLLAPLAVASVALIANRVLADQPLPPFDFADSFYTANGIDPTTLIARPTGTPPNSVIDNGPRPAGRRNIRLLDTTAAYDNSGHPIFFNVAGLPNLNSFLNNAAGQHALQIAEQYNVYENPRASNPPLSVFPKRQDLIADLRNGYFSNNPLGIWRLNIVRYTSAALNTPQGQAALAQIAARNGVDLDGTPLLRTVDEIEDLHQNGYVTIDIPPMDGSGGLRWFFCPVIEDPRNGVIKPDAHLTVTSGPAAVEFIRYFNCLQQTGDPCHHDGDLGDINDDGHQDAADRLLFVRIMLVDPAVAASAPRGDLNGDGAMDGRDVALFVSSYMAG